MTDGEFSAVLQPLVDAFPSFADFYAKNRQTLRAAWVKTLSFTDARDASAVVDRLITGQSQMPSNYEYDRMAIVIRREASDIKHRRTESQKVQKYRYETDPTKCTDKDERFFPALRELSRLGRLRGEGAVPETLGKQLAAEVRQWYFGERLELPRSMQESIESIVRKHVSGFV